MDIRHTYIHVGGPCDRQKLVYDQPYPQITVKGEVYLLTSMPAGSARVTFYLFDHIDQPDAVTELLTQYSDNSRDDLIRGYCNRVSEKKLRQFCEAGHDLCDHIGTLEQALKLLAKLGFDKSDLEAEAKNEDGRVD